MIKASDDTFWKWLIDTQLVTYFIGSYNFVRGIIMSFTGIDIYTQKKSPRVLYLCSKSWSIIQSLEQLQDLSLDDIICAICLCAVQLKNRLVRGHKLKQSGKIW